MTRTQFISLFTLPFVSRFLPKNEEKELPWALKMARTIWQNWQKEKGNPTVRKYPYTIHECYTGPEMSRLMDEIQINWLKVQNEIAKAKLNK